MKNCDVVVIGAGPGGYVCAIRLAQLGKKIILVEKHKLGGECLNYGCIPSKSLIFTSSLLDKIKSAEKLGLEVDNARINMEKLQTWRKGLITKLNQGIGFLLKQNGVELVTGEAHFIDSHKIEVTSPSLPQVIEAQNFVIATGSSAIQIPGFEVDGQKVIGSKEALVALFPRPKNLARELKVPVLA
ncbi:MAG: FAD-dependent oxidoreductase, partial [Deltaproteobacteria bacterium]|nr:FAD-dependent oxidoreductase [Deltaproteobacteria bacterium]